MLLKYNLFFVMHLPSDKIIFRNSLGWMEARIIRIHCTAEQHIWEQANLLFDLQRGKYAESEKYHRYQASKDMDPKAWNSVQYLPC